MYQRIAEPIHNLPDYDPRSGKHYWIVTAVWECKHPEEVMAGKDQLLDRENLKVLSPPICLFCENLWTPQLAKRRCRGE